MGSIVSLKNPLVRSEVNGRVLKLFVHTGTLVKPQQKLVQLSEERAKLELQRAQDKLAQTQKQFANDQLNAERLKKGYNSGAISYLHYQKAQTQAEISAKQLKISEDEISEAKNQLAKSIVKAPIGGHVQKIFVSEGDYVTPGGKLMLLINHDLLQAELPFSQNEVSHFQVGQKVTLTSPASPGKKFNGVISAIEPSIDPNNRSFHVYIRFSGNGDWRSGSSAHAVVILDKPVFCYIIPKESMVLKKGGNVIYYAKDNKAYAIPVNPLYYWDDKVAVAINNSSELDVIVDGAHYLANGTPIKIVK